MRCFHSENISKKHFTKGGFIKKMKTLDKHHPIAECFNSEKISKKHFTKGDFIKKMKSLDKHHPIG